MTFAIHGLPVARGVAIGRAVLVASSRLDVAHTFIRPDQVEGEIARLSAAREAVLEELQRLMATLPKDAPGELAGVLDYSGQEALDASLDSAERAFRAAVQRGMEQRLRGEPPRTGTSDPGAAFLARVRAAAGLET